MATKISSGFLAALFFFAVLNMSETAFAEWNITKILPMNGITGAEVCKPGDIHNAVYCGPTHDCNCCTNWCERMCNEMGTSVDAQKCRKFINDEGYPTLECDCCCNRYPGATTSTLKLSRGRGRSSITE